MVNSTSAAMDTQELNVDHLYKVTGLISNEKEKESKEFDLEKEKPKDEGEPADFETAIEATGYGKFHVLLMLAAMPAYWSTVYVSTTISYTLTGAECDLGINLMSKGFLNSMTYAGMLISAMFWGYLSDTLGRKNLMVYGLIALSIVEFLGSMSQAFWMLVTAKFIAGFISNGPFAVLLAYISELHSTKIRAQVVVLSGIFYSMALINLPLIAWAIIPQEWNFTFFNGAFEIHSWNIFLALFSLPPLISGLVLATMPESPKFLMSRGRNDEALEIFRNIYARNSGNPPENYPIKMLVDELKSAEKGDVRKTKGLAAILGGLKQIAPIWHRPYLPWLILICFLYMGSMIAENSLRLWFPQIASMLDDYTSKHSESAGLCVMLATHTVKPTVAVAIEGAAIAECVKLSTGTATYVNSIIVGASTIVSYALAGCLINRVGKRMLANIFYMLAVICPIALPWTTNIAQIVTLFSIFLAIAGTCSTAISSIIVDLFPTSLRAVAVAAFMMFGRIGSIIGTVAFPALLQTGCFPPFLAIAGVTFAAGIGCLLLPRTTFKKME